MSTIFMDESGDTGSDLLNPNQPIFTLATLCCSEEEAQEIKNRFFPSIHAYELKHKNLRKHHEQFILEVLHDIFKKPRSVKIDIIHKQYLLTGKLVDMLIAPAAEKRGVNLYVNKQNIALTNILFIYLPQLAGDEFFNNSLQHFQRLMNKLDSDSYTAFFEPLLDSTYISMLESRLQTEEDRWSLRFLINQILSSYFDIGYDLIVQLRREILPLNTNPLDISMTGTLYQMSEWGKDLSEEITLIFDKTLKATKLDKIWKLLVDPNLPPATVTFGSSLTFPIRVTETHYEESEKWAGIQLADLIAGAANHWAKWHLTGMQLKNKDDEYASKLETIFSNFPIHMIWPSINVTPEQFGITDNDHPSNLDYFHQIFQNHYSNYYAQIFQRLSKMGVIGFTYEVPPLNMGQEGQEAYVFREA